MAGKNQLSKPLETSAEENIIKKVIKSHFWASGSGVGYVKNAPISVDTHEDLLKVEKLI